MKQEITDTSSLAHTKWNCKYHIVFAPKYRRKVFYSEKRLEIREIMRQLCKWKGGRHNRGRNMPRPHTYASKYPAQDERFGIHGISERKKFVTNIPEMGKHEICIPKSRILV